MNKPLFYLFWIAGGILAAVVLALAIVAFLAEKQGPSNMSAASSQAVEIVSVQGPTGATTDQNAGTSVRREEENNIVYEAVVQNGPMNM